MLKYFFMIRTSCFILFYLLLFRLCCAQNPLSTDTIWRNAIQTGININQTSLSDNWKGGGSNSLALGTFINAKAVAETKDISFVNELQAVYGLARIEDQEFRKNRDRIFADTKFGWKFSGKWELFASVNYMSQFDRGYLFYSDSIGVEHRTLTSRFMSPGYLTSSVGVEYKPAEYFWIRFGTGTIRQTFVLDTTIYHAVEQNYGVPVGKRMRNEAAFQFIANFDKEIMKNTILKARLMSFANYETLKAIDTRLDISFIAKINKFINVNLTGTVLYDQDMDYKIQYTQALALGILFNYTEFKEK
jgi:hypothetical protein